MESSTSNGHDFDPVLSSNAAVEGPPTTAPPTLNLHFEFQSSSFSFQPDLRVLQDPIGWRQAVERKLLTVLHGSGGRGPFSVSRLANAYCRYFDAIFESILVNDEMVLSEEADWESDNTPALSAYAEAAFLESVLKVVVFGEGEAEEVYVDDSCSICLGDFEVGQQLYVMPCHHRFHMECLKNWLARSHACPLCRFDLFLGCQLRSN